MKDLVDTVGLRTVLTGRGIREEENIELLYSNLSADPAIANLIDEIEQRIRTYFSSLVLPATPTLYDYLILGLRQKDLIATFNWDPLLFQALRRSEKATTHLPGIVFLHGCVAVGVCHEHKYVAGSGQRCKRCHRPLEPVRLLYPVAKKDYNQNPLIRDDWATLGAALEEAYYLTFVGYSFPTADAAAKKMLQEAWTPNRVRNRAEIDVVDISPSDDLLREIQRFRTQAHGVVVGCPQETEPFINPRRSCEALWKRTIELSFDDGRPFPMFTALEDLHSWVKGLVAEEPDKEE